MNLQVILETFNSLNPHEQIKFLYEKLSSLSQEYQIPFLLATINDEKTPPIVLATALKFLPKSGYKNRDVLHQFLKNPHPAVTQAAKRALSELSILEEKDIDRSKPGVQSKESSYRKQRKLKTIKEMAKINASWVPKVLLEDLEDSNEEIRDFIVNELAYREDLNLNTVHQKLFDAPWYIKSSILKLLARLKNPLSIIYIEDVVNDSNSEVRQSAARTLGEIGGEKASELLIRLAKDQNPYVRKSAEEALEKISTLKFI